MATVQQAELEQKTSEFIFFVKNYMALHKKDMIMKGKSDNFKLSIFAGDATLEFSV